MYVLLLLRRRCGWCCRSNDVLWRLVEAAGTEDDGTQHRLTWVEDGPWQRTTGAVAWGAFQKSYSPSPSAGSSQDREVMETYSLLIYDGACGCLGWRDYDGSATAEKRQNSNNSNRCIFYGIDPEESKQALEIAKTNLSRVDDMKELV